MNSHVLKEVLSTSLANMMRMNSIFPCFPKAMEKERGFFFFLFSFFFFFMLSKGP
jgi:hypothetical protein